MVYKREITGEFKPITILIHKPPRLFFLYFKTFRKPSTEFFAYLAFLTLLFLPTSTRQTNLPLCWFISSLFTIFQLPLFGYYFGLVCHLSWYTHFGLVCCFWLGLGSLFLLIIFSLTTFCLPLFMIYHLITSKMFHVKHFIVLIRQKNNMQDKAEPEKTFAIIIFLSNCFT